MKRDYLPHELGESTVDAMRKVCIPPPFLSFTCPLVIRFAVVGANTLPGVVSV